eukprot:9491531-Pyramimonas_sp.AAC.1
MGDITNDDSEVTIPRNFSKKVSHSEPSTLLDSEGINPFPPSAKPPGGFVEVFSPPRVSPLLRKYQVKVQGSWDLTTGWDFRLERHQRKAKAH